MTWNLNEPFSSKVGSWQDFAPTDTTERFDSVSGWLYSVNHTDLRNFRVIQGTVPVPQTDLEAVAQTVLDAEPQTDMEVKPGAIIASENWELTASDGSHDDLVVGKLDDFGGWSGARFTADGTPFDVILASVITQPVDITKITDDPHLRITFPDYDNEDFDQGSSMVQLCSGDGGFGDGHDSSEVSFTTSTGSSKYLLVDVADFANTGFDPTAVTGVRVRMANASGIPDGTNVTLMAIRIEASSWDGGSYIDFDTQLEAAVVPVSFDGSYPPPFTDNGGFQFVRGDGSGDDPIPADVAMNVYFSPGGETTPNDATGGDLNVIGLIFREKKDSVDGTGSHIEVDLSWNDGATQFNVYRVDTTGGSPGSQSYFSPYEDLTLPILDPTLNYVFRAELVGTAVAASLYETDLDHNVGALVWQLDITLSDPEYIYRNGRVGWVLGLLSRDAYVDSIVVAPQGFATWISEVFTSRTPVDGAQLRAIFSSDKNLWDGYTGLDILIDQTKTLSGVGSWRTARGLTSNTFIVDDWTQMYFDFQIWVPNVVTLANQPHVVLNTDDGPERIVIQKLQPAQWNFVHCDLTVFQNLINGVGYSLSITTDPAADPSYAPDRPLGNFWVDETVIGRRRIAWSLRARANGPFREFKDMVNNPVGAVHLNPEERGTELQLKAVALTEDAWVSSIKLWPHYAPLGNLVTDTAFNRGLPLT